MQSPYQFQLTGDEGIPDLRGHDTTAQRIMLHVNGDGLQLDDLEQAMVYWRRGDRASALYHLDKSGFHGIDARGS